jgi:tripartite-type tricarboxylate transporter receptor subunit TctC
MNPVMRIFGVAYMLAAFAVAPAVLAQKRDPADGYPNKPIRLVVPFGSGSGPDVRSRQLGQKLADDWGQSVVVENRPGAGGQLAMEQVARAQPDGHTLVMAGQSPVAIAPHMVKVRYDPLKDFAAVTRTSKGAIILVVNADVPLQSIAELINHAKRNPGKLNAASWGSATITHLALELFMRTAGVKIVHVPYKAAGQAITELMGGQVQLTFDFYPAISAQVKAGRLRAIGVSGRVRLAALQDVPTFTEAGLVEMETVSGWQGVAVPVGTPRQIVNKLRNAVARALALPDVKASYMESGFEAVGDTPEEFTAFIKSEHARWGKLILDAGIRAE